MKQHWTFGSEQLIMHHLIPSTILIFFGTIIATFFDYRFSLFYICCYCMYFLLVRLFLIPNAFSISKWDEGTIQNKHLTLAWEEIENIEICDVRIHRRDFRTVDLDSVICIGNPYKASFRSQSSKKSIFVPMSKKNLQKLKECGYGKSKALDEILDRYAF